MPYPTSPTPRRRNHHPLFRALFRLQRAYEVRDGHDFDGGITVLVEDPQGDRWPVRLSRQAADDLAMVIEDLTANRCQENDTSGALLQACADSNTGQIIARLESSKAAPPPAKQQHMIRTQFEKAAALAEQPDAISALISGRGYLGTEAEREEGQG